MASRKWMPLRDSKRAAGVLLSHMVRAVALMNRAERNETGTWTIPMQGISSNDPAIWVLGYRLSSKLDTHMWPLQQAFLRTFTHAIPVSSA